MEVIASSRRPKTRWSRVNMRVLDLGCGDGLTPHKLNLPSSWQIIVLDVKFGPLSKAHINFPHRAFFCLAQERLPFPLPSFIRGSAVVRLQYVDVRRAAT